MIALLTILLTLALMGINLLGLTLAATRLTRSYAVAKAAGPVLLVTPLFFLEHFVGLGGLAWLWPPTTAASLWLVHRDFAKVKANWRVEALFLAGFGYALAWRFCFPDLNAASERLADLGFIANYIDGTRLPPVDRWFPPFAFDIYYGLQFYAVALLGRVLGVGAGTAYQLGFCALVGLATAAAGSAARRFCEGRRWYLLVTAVFLVGGTGSSPLVHLLRAHPPVSDSVRFIGGAATPGHVTTEFGRRLVAAAGVPAKDALELPAETFGYLVYLGDLHPPMAGFFLLALAMVCLAALETGEEERFPQAILAATVPLTLAADAWNLPLQGGLVAFWLLWRVASRRPPCWRAVVAGAGAGFAAIFPFLSTYAWRTTEYSKAIERVPPGEHTPPLLGFLLLYPLLAVLAAALWTRRTRSFGFWLAVFCLALLAVSEALFVDDVYGGKYNRFNTTLKWWPWIWALGLIVVASHNLARGGRVRRALTIAALVAPGWFALDLAAQFARTPKPHMGLLSGDGWIRADRIERPMLEFLKCQPRGIVLQRLAKGSFTEAPALVMFGGETAFLGWPEHEKLWRGYRADITRREDEVARFYRGELENAGEWLAENAIDHVLWLKSEAGLPAGAFDRIQAQIGSRYYWREYDRAGETRVGIWSRRTR